MPKTFVTLDTNILIRYATQGLPGCELEQFEILRRSIEHGTVILLVTEVVELEFQKEFQKCETVLETKIASIGKSLPKVVDEAGWNEISDLKSALDGFLSHWTKEKLSAVKSRQEQILKLFNCGKSVRIKFTPEIMFSARKRMLEGGFKESANHNDADCYLIQSLVHYFNNAFDDKQLLLCSEDKGFGIDKTVLLHPRIQNGLPKGELFLNLTTLNTFIEQHKAIEVPPPAAVAKAVEDENVETQSTVAKIYADAIKDLNSHYYHSPQRYREAMQAYEQLSSQLPPNIGQTFLDWQEAQKQIEDYQKHSKDISIMLKRYGLI